MISRLFLTLLAGALLSGQGSQSRNEANPYTSDEAYAVYSAVLPWLSQDVLPRTPHKYVILDETLTAKSPVGCFPSDYGSRFNAAFHDFEKVNQRHWRLLRQFDLKREYEFVTVEQLQGMTEVFAMPSKDLDEISAGGRKIAVFRWEEFYKRFADSGGYFELSAVGFNSPPTKAVVSVALHCGGLCAKSADYLLERDGGRWKILRVESTCGGVS